MTIPVTFATLKKAASDLCTFGVEKLADLRPSVLRVQYAQQRGHSDGFGGFAGDLSIDNLAALGLDQTAENCLMANNKLDAASAAQTATNQSPQWV